MYSNYPDGVNGSSDYFNKPEVADAEVIDQEADANKIKQLALAQALYKNIAAMVKTGDEFNLRGEVDAIMRERFMQAKKLGLAPKSFDIEIDGEKVGTYSISTTKQQKAKNHKELRVDNDGEFRKWAIEHGCVEIDLKAVDEHFKSTGEVPDGCSYISVETPAIQGGKINKTSLRIDPQKVSYALGANLGEMTEWLLEGGEE